MKISELIKHLNDVLKEEGDLEVLKEYDCIYWEYDLEEITVDITGYGTDEWISTCDYDDNMFDYTNIQKRIIL